MQSSPYYAPFFINIIFSFIFQFFFLKSKFFIFKSGCRDLKMRTNTHINRFYDKSKVWLVKHIVSHSIIQ